MKNNINLKKYEKKILKNFQKQTIENLFIMDGK